TVPALTSRLPSPAARRQRLGSNRGPPPDGERDQNSTLAASGLVEEGRRVRGAGRARVLGIDLARGNVAQLVADDPDPHGPGRLPHGADAVLLVDQDLPDLLGDLVALLGLLARGRSEKLEGRDHSRILGRLSLGAVG